MFTMKDLGQILLVKIKHLQVTADVITFKKKAV